jgi:hypothetical protein
MVSSNRPTWVSNITPTIPNSNKTLLVSNTKGFSEKQKYIPCIGQ